MDVGTGPLPSTTRTKSIGWTSAVGHAEVIAAFPNIDPIYCSPSDDELRSSLDQMMWLHEVPIRSSSAVSYYFLMKLAAQTGIKVMLDGQGADTHLAGSSGSFDRLIGGYLRKLRDDQGIRGAARLSPPRNLSAGATWLVAACARPFEESGSCHAAEYRDRCSSLGFDGDLAFELRKVGGSRLKQYLYHLLFSTTLPSVLHNMDRMSMGFSIESRVPFLDHRLVEFAYSLQDEDLVSRGQTKYHFACLPGRLSAKSDRRQSRQTGPYGQGDRRVAARSLAAPDRIANRFRASSAPESRED